MKTPLIALFLATAQFGGCATFRPTPYQPSIDGGYGYRDERIGLGEYRIMLSGNDATSAQALYDQLLFRAAEITLAAGYEYFVMVPNGAGQIVDIEPAFLMPQFGIGPGGGTRLIQYEGYPVGVEPSRQLIATATIAVSEGKQEGAQNVFDAAEVKQRLGSNIVFPSN